MRNFYSPKREFTCPFKSNGIFVGKLSCQLCEHYIGQDQWSVYCNNDEPSIYGSVVKDTLENVVSWLRLQKENKLFNGECHLNDKFKKIEF